MEQSQANPVVLPVYVFILDINLFCLALILNTTSICRYMETALIDVDVQPTYIRIKTKGRVSRTSGCRLVLVFLLSSIIKQHKKRSLLNLV